MSDLNLNNQTIRFKVGLFSVLGLLLLGAMTVFVNDKPFWWRSCKLVHINVADATGLKKKSPVRSLGLKIGYLRTVELSETHVRLGICLTAPVEVIDSTRAYIRGEGFLGDKFVEIRPVKYVGETKTLQRSLFSPSNIARVWNLLVPSVQAETDSSAGQVSSNEIPVGTSNQDIDGLVKQVNGLVGEMKELTTNLKGALDEKTLKTTIVELNRLLKNASNTLSPQGGLTRTAQKVLVRLEEAVEQLRQQMTRINQGKGSMGRLLNDPVFAEKIELAIDNMNKLLSKVGTVRFVVNVGAEQLPAFNGGRGWFSIEIWPTPTRIYRLGIGVDPRGKLLAKRTKTIVDGVASQVETVETEDGGLLLTGMLGKRLWDRLEFAVGVKHGDGTFSIDALLGSYGETDRIRLSNDIYVRSEGFKDSKIHNRMKLTVFPATGPYLKNLYLSGGLESFKRVDGELNYSFGAGVSFDDQAIKLIFSFI